MHLDGFISYLRFEKRYSAKTLTAYTCDLSQFLNFLNYQYQLTDTDLNNISHRHVRSWIVAMMQDKISSKSVNRKLSAVKTFFKYLIKKGAVVKNPMLKVIAPKVAKPLPAFVDNNGINDLFKLIDENYPSVSEMDNFTKLRDKLIIELLYDTGMRRGELTGLTYASFDQSNKTIKVVGKGNKERIIPVGNGLALLINAYEMEKNRLFGNTGVLIITGKGKPAYDKLIYNIVHALLKNVTSLTKKSPHILRHTFATHITNNGAELNAVKELLGHASLASTQVYTHNSIEKLKDIHRLAHPKG